MTRDEALVMVTNVCREYRGTHRDHELLDEALELIADQLPREEARVNGDKVGTDDGR